MSDSDVWMCISTGFGRRWRLPCSIRKHRRFLWDVLIFAQMEKSFEEFITIICNSHHAKGPKTLVSNGRNGRSGTRKFPLPYEFPTLKLTSRIGPWNKRDALQVQLLTFNRDLSDFVFLRAGKKSWLEFVRLTCWWSSVFGQNPCFRTDSCQL